MATRRPYESDNEDGEPIRKRGRAHDDSLAEPFTDPLYFDERLSFRHYVKYMSEHAHRTGEALPTQEEWIQKYKNYRVEYKWQALWSYFLHHQGDEWFKEKYSPDVRFQEARKQRRRAGRIGHKKAWLNELRAGVLDHVSFDLKASSSTQPTSMYTVTNRYGNEKHYDTDILTIPPDSEHQLLVRTWPPDLPRVELEDHLRTCPGFRYVALLEPIPQRRYHRAGIAVFEPGTDMREAIRRLDGKMFGDFMLHLAVMDRPSNSRLRIAPASTNTLSRLTTDLARAKKLLVKMEDEDRTSLFADEFLVGGDTWTWLGVSLCDEIAAHLQRLAPRDADSDKEKRVQLKKALDLHLDALRRVYHVDYYLCLQCDSREELERRSACHVRRQPAEVDEEATYVDVEHWWLDHHDTKIKLFLDPAHVLPMVGGIDRDALEESLTSQYIVQLDEGKFQCTVPTSHGACGKLFKAAGFTRKHIRNRHTHWLEERGGDRYAFASYFNSYLCDPMRMMSTNGPKDGKSEDVPRPASPLRAGERAVQQRAAPRSSRPGCYQDLDGAASGEITELQY